MSQANLVKTFIRWVCDANLPANGSATTPAHPPRDGPEGVFLTGFGEADDPSDGAFQASSLSLVNPVEQVEVTRINLPRQKCGVIQRNPLGIRRIDRFQRRGDLVQESHACPLINRVPSGDTSCLALRVRRVGRVQRRDHTRPEPREELVILPPRFHSCRCFFLLPRPEKRSRTPGADEHRKGFVERRLASCIERVVRDFVDDGICEGQRIALQGRAEKWIVEEAKGAERVGRTEIGVEPFLLHLSSGADRLVEIEVAFVWHAADYRKPPGVRLKGIAVSRRQKQHKSVAVKARICRKTVVYS